MLFFLLDWWYWGRELCSFWWEWRWQNEGMVLWLTVMISPHPFSLNLATDSLKTWGPGHRDKLKIWQLFEQQQKALLKYQHNSNWCWISGWKRKLNVWQKKLYLRAQYCESWRERGVTIWSYYMDSQAKHLVK